MCPNRPLSTPTCPACQGYGPQARADGARYDSAGIDYPCPDCGTTARQGRLRAPVVPAIGDRAVATNQVRACPELAALAREHCPDEDLDALAALVVDTARTLGIDPLDAAFLPETAIAVTRREWVRLDARREQRVSSVLSRLAAVLSRLDDDELMGQLVQLEERAALLDPEGRPEQAEPEGVQPRSPSTPTARPARQPSPEALRDATEPELGAQEGAPAIVPVIEAPGLQVYTDGRGFLVVQPPTGAEQLARSIPEADLSRIVRHLAIDFDIAGRTEQLRAMLAVLPAETVQREIAELAADREGARARRAAEEGDRQRRKVEAEQRAERRAQQRQLWADFLESHREEIAALRARTAPVELPQGVTRWLAVASPSVRGVGRTIEEARAAFIEEGLSWIENPERAADAFGDEIPEHLSGVVPEPMGYLRLCGPEALVEEIASVLAGLVL